MVAPTGATDDAPTTPISRSDMRRAAANPRRRALPLVDAGVTVLLVAVAVAATAVALTAGSKSSDPLPSVSASPPPASPTTEPARPTVPVGGLLFSFTGSANDRAEVDADGAVVAVLDDGSPGRSGMQLSTYDQATGAQLAVTEPGLPELLGCGVFVVRRPDGTSVVLTRYDTETPASGIQLGRREAHVAARDGRTLRPVWDAVLFSEDTTGQTLLVDTVCSDGVPAFFPTANGRFVLNRSFEVSRLLDLATGSMRPVPSAANVVGDDVLVAEPPASAGEGTPPDLTGPSVVGAVRLVASGDLRTRATIPEGEIASALARVGPPGRPTLDGFISTGSDTRYTDTSLSGDARTLALRAPEQVSLIDLPSGRVRATIPTGSVTNQAVLDPSERPLAIVPGDAGHDVVLVATPRRDTDQTQDDVYTAYDLDGRRLWALPAGAADGICEIGRGLLLLRAAGLTSLEPASGRQLSVGPSETCPEVTAGLGVTSNQNTAASTSAEYTVTALHRP